MIAALYSSIKMVLRDFLQHQLPHAQLIAQLGERVFLLTVDRERPLQDLVPPTEWEQEGRYEWLMRDGALLGMLWSREPLPQKAIQTLTQMLAQFNGQSETEADKFFSHLPTAIAFLNYDFYIKQVSRPFLELLDLRENEVLNQHISSLMDHPRLWELFENAVAGRSGELQHWLMDRWIKTSIKPYFGGTEKGILWHIQDNTSEYEADAQLQALMKTKIPLALLDQNGMITQESHGLTLSLTDKTSLLYQRRIAKDQLKLLQEHGTLTFSERSRVFRLRQIGEYVLLEEEMPETASVLAAYQSALLLDRSGKIREITDGALELIEGTADHFIGQPLLDVLRKLGYQLTDTQAIPLQFPNEWTFPIQEEVIFILPSGAYRHLRVQANMDHSGYLLTLEDLTTLRQTQARLQHSTTHDTLTNLYNTTGLRQFLKKKQTGTLALIDIAEFARIEAALGRTAGDLLLILIATRLQDLATELRGAAARLRDNTFALYLPLEAEETLDELDDILGLPFKVHKHSLDLQFALGVALISTDTLADAEMALKHSKRTGKPTTFLDHFREEEAKLFALQNDLREAAEQGLFQLYYQPIIDADTLQISGAEALIRWEHQQYGWIPPGQFLELAKQNNLILALGTWVACSAMKARSFLDKPLRISINLSLHELRAAESWLLPLVEECSLDIEIPTRSFVEDYEDLTATISLLRQKGCRIIIDDFGQKYTNLSALKDLELDSVKLHASLVKKLAEPKAKALIQGAVLIAHAYGLGVIASGVETEEDLHILRELGVDELQGFLIAEPLTLEALQHWETPSHLTEELGL